ncbi:two-partner secretion domain-containing protein [Burkholderia stagnalis]|uniref:two-partner secretion domain-containing protein n=1 Tax=Burkholderia stagnalis TaxID=1503054 RepID=UPI000F5F282A|nr:filamentous hemagglutinin N-terminal domain-containing protein [Burkholderia stagnalis]RQY03462.1 filamentous hemagglutinin N-terminal domain-containing protein [Burkholderia stagnalis]
MKNQQHYPRHRAATPFARTALAAALTVAMPILAMQTASAQPALVADPSAANRPGLGVASNGTPIVDINAPNAAGISTNRFLDYNVGSSGLVLNNSVGRTNTQLAGSIDGNAQLGGRSAQVILNQVTGGNASMLAGATEVAGQNARVIVANPNGISVNGASFINANRVSLVAGTVELDQNGGITQFRTKDGHIAIDGDGLDASSQDRLDLVSRTLKVNAAVQAKKLVAVAQEGVAAIEHSNLEIFKASPDSGAVDVAIDVSKLGSMHADSIMMRGASAGVGVNVAGKVEALTGEIKLMSDGKIQVSADGRLAAAGELHADGKLQNAGTIAGSKLTLMKGVANTGTLRADGKILAMADVNNSGSIYGGNGVDIVGNLHQEAPGVVGANGKVSVLGKTTGSGTIDENMTKPPVNLEPPVAETKPPVNPEPPVAETNPPVNPEPPVAETKPPVDPEPPVAETKPPVDPEPPVAETNPPVNPEPPVAETKPPVDPEPPVAETKPQLVVDPNAADRPVVKSAANGTPIVDIAEANSAGISHNRFLDYNVGAAGLVLNNSVAGAHTQLAGDIGGNALLNGRSASIILNQVTGGNASVLAGTTEVAGQSARVIVANPNGISVNGGSFVNANRVSLVAGATEFDGQGNIARFRTDDGRIAIEGAGLDAYGMDQLDLVSRGLKVDGAVHGNKLVAVAQQGTAAIEGAKPQIVSGPANGVTPDVAIDVSESGSLHADAVTLVGTSAKTGVRIAGTVDAPAGSLSLASSGTARIERSGRVQADTLAIQGGLDNDGTVSGNTVDVAGNLGNGGSIRGGDVRLSGDVDNRGEIGGERALEVMGSLNNDGTVRGGDVKVAGNVVNQGSVTSGGALDIMGHLTNNGAASLVDGRDVQVTGDVVNEGTVNGDGALKVNGSLNNDGAVRGGSIKVMGNAVNRGSVTSDGVLGIMGHLTNSGAGSVVDGRDVQVMGNVVNQGAVNSDGTLKFVGSLTNNGTVRGGDVQVTGNTTNNGELRGEHTVFTTGNVTNRGMLHGGNSVFVMGRLYNGLFGVTSSYGKVSSMVRMSGPGRVVSNMARP